jgi:ABC-type nickel/cobalt efflux system permease component RcnA
MCILCGGVCGGAGDVLLLTAGTSLPLAMLAVRSKLVSKKARSKDRAETIDEDIASDSEQQVAD